MQYLQLFFNFRCFCTEGSFVQPHIHYTKKWLLQIQQNIMGNTATGVQHTATGVQQKTCRGKSLV